MNENKAVEIYFEYMVAMINLSVALCEDRNGEAIGIIKSQIGIDDYFMIAVADTDERAIVDGWKFN